MHAKLVPGTDDAWFVDAQEISRRLREACPQAVIDWDRGEAWVHESLQRLIDHKTPEVILESHRRLFGRTVFISLSYPEWPDRPVYCIVSGLERDLGDALFLEVTEPFDLDLLKRGAKDLAAAMGFEYCLECRRDSVLTTLSRPGGIDPVEFVRWDMPAHTYPTIELQALTDWKGTLHRSILCWIFTSEYQDKIQAILTDFASHAAFADAVRSELEAVAPVQCGWGIDVAEMPYQNAILLSHGRWMTIVRLFGVLRQIVNGPASEP